MQGFRLLLSALAVWSRDIPGARAKITFAMLLGLMAGFGSTVLLSVINSVLIHGPSRSKLLTFVITCVAVPLSGFAAQVLLVQLTSRATRDLRLRLSNQILATPHQRLEQLGFSKTAAIMTEDVPIIITAMVNIPILFTQTAVVAGSLAYLGWLCWPLLIILLAYMVLGIFTYQLPLRFAMQSFQRVREYWDSFFSGMQALSFGNKELKLHQARREAFLTEQFVPSIDGLQVHTARAAIFTAGATNWGQILFFLFIGLSLFAIPLLIHITRQALSGYTITILFIITPLTIILNLLSSYGQSTVALKKVEDLDLSLTSVSLKSCEVDSTPLGWKSLELQAVVHTHNQQAEEAFHLGPLNLCIYPEETLFITGGNGSGKTTLAKLLIGLYEPEQGRVLLDNEEVTSTNRPAYRQLFSTVFSDFFLFERFYGIDQELVSSKGAGYLRDLQLDHKVQIVSNRLSTLDLSQGQRKRLALLTAYLEDRPVYVFDEWASDQDPLFRSFFYHTILPDLKLAHKTVIVITHDDRYYDLADRLIKLEEGQLISDTRAGGTLPQAPETIHLHERDLGRRPGRVVASL